MERLLFSGQDWLFIWLPLLALVAVAGLPAVGIALGNAPTLLSWSRRPKLEVDETAGLGALPRGWRRASSGELVLDVAWLERPPVLGAIWGLGTWMLLALFSMLVANLTLTAVDQRHLAASMAAKTFCIWLIPLTLLYIKHLLEDWLVCALHFVQLDPAETLERFGRPIANLFLGRENLLMGVVIGVGTLGFESSDRAFIQPSLWSKAIILSTSFVMTSLAGFALVVVVRGVVLIHDVSHVPIYVSASPFGVLRTGRLLALGFLAATVVLAFAISTMLLRPPPHRWVIVSWPTSVTLLYVVGFLAPQWSIHRRMVTFKRYRLIGLETHMRRHQAAFDSGPTRSVGDMLEALRKRREEIESLPEWPFNWKNFSSVLGLAASGPLAAIVKSGPLAIASPGWVRSMFTWAQDWLGLGKLLTD